MVERRGKGGGGGEERDRLLYGLLRVIMGYYGSIREY